MLFRSEVPVNLNHVLSNKANVSEAIYEHESGMKIMPSSLSIKELKKINPEKIKNFRKEFKKMSDYIIVDSSAGLGNEALSTIELADELIVVTNPEIDRKSTRLNSSHTDISRMPSSA